MEFGHKETSVWFAQDPRVCVMRCSLLCGLAAAASAFYLPGMTPVTFKPDDRVKIRVNKLTSTKTQRTCAPLFFCQHMRRE